MKLAALFSGGKDSTYAVHLAQQKNWEVAHLVSLFPEANDSYMFHVPNIHLTPMLADALGINFVRQNTKGEKEKELEDLRVVLASLEIDGVITGAIASNYQRTRIQYVCNLLGLACFNPLWDLDQKVVLGDMLDAGFQILVVGVFAEGLGEDWLGRKLDSGALAELESIAARYGINVSGEGGEFESLVVDGPNFFRKLEIVDSEIEWDGMSGVLRITDARLVEK
jgi:ABC transporter with metal-binding/Fe-S-binding domain ATP-binding protein